MYWEVKLWFSNTGGRDVSDLLYSYLFSRRLLRAERSIRFQIFEGYGYLVHSTKVLNFPS